MSSVLLGSPERPLRVAVVGAGPSGFYATAALLGEKEMAVEVDLYDRLPAPYGLVRGGVAPDHQKIKGVVRAYQRTAAHPRFRFFGNVRIGEDLTVETLRRHYDQLVFAIGAESAREMGIEGEHLPGSVSATAFVGWYNGHPDYCDLQFDLDVERVVVVGVGNVAVDVARILVKDRDALAKTDIADYALDALRRSRVTDVFVLGRRGAAQASFTPAELKELDELPGVDLLVPDWSATLDPMSQRYVESAEKAVRRNIEILQAAADRGPTGAPKRIHLWMLRSPVEVLGADRMTGVRIEHNELVGTEPDGLRSRGTGHTEVLEAGMMLRAVGYRGVPLPGLPFEERWGTVPNEEGRVLDEGGAPVPDTYVVGWAKRGASGVIGTNRADANETVGHMLADARDRVVRPDPERTAEAALHTVQLASPGVVRWEDWERIDAAELARGEAAGRIRSKFTRVAEMLEVAAQAREG